mmetsp:Transcript_63324/g.169287  ORF Transcript_63324/g.169287 Transcript_63324/m.169287 type:complete len:255 (-) Transcript_63324:109-873(-)
MIIAATIAANNRRREKMRRDREEEARRLREEEEARARALRQQALDERRRQLQRWEYESALREREMQKAKANFMDQKEQEYLNSIPRHHTVEYRSQEACRLLERLGLTGNQQVKFSAQSISLDGYIGTGSVKNNVRVVYVQRPRHLDDGELWTLLYNSMSRHATLARLVDQASAIASDKGLEIPDDFLCPITLDIMCDPVVASDGHTYEYSAIAEWLRTHARSPLTNGAMRAEDLRTNLERRNEIDAWARSLLDY